MTCSYLQKFKQHLKTTISAAFHTFKNMFVIFVEDFFRACTQMTLRPRGHSFDVPRVVYEFDKTILHHAIFIYI